MLTDAHCHLSDLLKRFPAAETERERRGIPCAASAWNEADFACHEALARQVQAAPILLCFGVHPQLPALAREQADFPSLASLLTCLETLADEDRLDGIGETGFDLYHPAFQNTEAIQDELFAVHLELALRKGLPLVLHVRKALHKVFVHTKALKKLPALIFHSYPGSLEEGKALLKRGINGYFSFGTPILRGRKETLRSCAGLPLDRLLLETDAPYQSLRGAPFSHWGDLPVILQTAAHLREQAGSPGQTVEELETLIEENFYRAYGNLRNITPGERYNMVSFTGTFP